MPGQAPRADGNRVELPPRAREVHPSSLSPLSPSEQQLLDDIRALESELEAECNKAEEMKRKFQSAHDGKCAVEHVLQGERSKLADLEKKLQAECGARAELESALQAERARRTDLEARLELECAELDALERELWAERAVKLEVEERAESLRGENAVLHAEVLAGRLSGAVMRHALRLRGTTSVGWSRGSVEAEKKEEESVAGGGGGGAGGGGGCAGGAAADRGASEVAGKVGRMTEALQPSSKTTNAVPQCTHAGLPAPPAAQPALDAEQNAPDAEAPEPAAPRAAPALLGVAEEPPRQAATAPMQADGAGTGASAHGPGHPQCRLEAASALAPGASLHACDVGAHTTGSEVPEACGSAAEEAPAAPDVPCVVEAGDRTHRDGSPVECELLGRVHDSRRSLSGRSGQQELAASADDQVQKERVAGSRVVVDLTIDLTGGGSGVECEGDAEGLSSVAVEGSGAASGCPEVGKSRVIKATCVPDGQPQQHTQVCGPGFALLGRPGVACRGSGCTAGSSGAGAGARCSCECAVVRPGPSLLAAAPGEPLREARCVAGAALSGGTSRCTNGGSHALDEAALGFSQMKAEGGVPCRTGVQKQTSLEEPGPVLHAHADDHALVPPVPMAAPSIAVLMDSYGGAAALAESHEHSRDGAGGGKVGAAGPPAVPSGAATVGATSAEGRGGRAGVGADLVDDGAVGPAGARSDGVPGESARLGSGEQQVLRQLCACAAAQTGTVPGGVLERRGVVGLRGRGRKHVPSRTRPMLVFRVAAAAEGSAEKLMWACDGNAESGVCGGVLEGGVLGAEVRDAEEGAGVGDAGSGGEKETGRACSVAVCAGRMADLTGDGSSVGACKVGPLCDGSGKRAHSGSLEDGSRGEGEDAAPEPLNDCMAVMVEVEEWAGGWGPEGSDAGTPEDGAMASCEGEQAAPGESSEGQVLLGDRGSADAPCGTPRVGRGAEAVPWVLGTPVRESPSGDAAGVDALEAPADADRAAETEARAVIHGSAEGGSRAAGVPGWVADVPHSARYEHGTSRPLRALGGPPDGTARHAASAHPDHFAAAAAGRDSPGGTDGKCGAVSSGENSRDTTAVGRGVAVGGAADPQPGEDSEDEPSAATTSPGVGYGPWTPRGQGGAQGGSLAFAERARARACDVTCCPGSFGVHSSAELSAEVSSHDCCYRNGPAAHETHSQLPTAEGAAAGGCRGFQVESGAVSPVAAAIYGAGARRNGSNEAAEPGHTPACLFGSCSQRHACLPDSRPTAASTLSNFDLNPPTCRLEPRGCPDGAGAATVSRSQRGVAWDGAGASGGVGGVRWDGEEPGLPPWGRKRRRGWPAGEIVYDAGMLSIWRQVTDAKKQLRLTLLDFCAKA